jgi:hypothetical protein
VFSVATAVLEGRECVAGNHDVFPILRLGFSAEDIFFRC